MSFIMVSFEATQPILQETNSALSVLLDEVIVEFGDDTVRANGVDPAGVAMIDVTLSEDAFESYTGDQERRGIDLDRLGSIVGMAQSDEVLSVDEADTGRITIESSGLEYTMALISPDSVREGQDIPDLDWDAELTADAEVLKRGVKACGMVSDHLKLEVNDGAFCISASGDTDEVTLDTSEEEDVNVEFESDDPDECESIFSLEYLSDIIKELPGAESVDIAFGDDFPVVISASLADGAGQVTYALAPRIQD